MGFYADSHADIGFDSCCDILSDDDCASLASGMTGDEDPEDEEMEAAAQHLNQEFMNQMLEQGDQGGSGGE